LRYSDLPTGVAAADVPDLALAEQLFHGFGGQPPPTRSFGYLLF
jgi:hypothetical protein